MKTMDKETLIAQLKEIVKPYAKNEEALLNINENTDFVNDLKINSANLVDVILDVEEQFNIVIDNESMERMLNVKSAIEIIEAKLAAQ
jgi:acyl carrier protein